MREREAALAFSKVLDRELAGEQTKVVLEDPGLLQVARRLSRLPDLLPAADPAIHQKLLPETTPPGNRPRAGRVWWRVLAPTTAVLLLLAAVGLTMPGGMQTLAGFAARFGLGGFSVEVTPQPGGDGEAFAIATRQRLESLGDAQALVGYALLTPAELPPGYELQEVVAVSYEGMPLWIPQPFYLELEYRTDGSPELHHLTLREFGLAVQEGEYIRRVRQVDFASKDVSQAEDVLLGDLPAVLLTMEINASVPALRRLIWQQGEVVLEMMSQTLATEEILDVARHMTDGR